MELRHDDALGTIDHESALVSHIRYLTQIDILNHSGEVLVVRVGTIQFELRFERHRIGQAALKAFSYSVTWGIDIVVEKFQYEIVTGVGNREVLGKYFVKPLVVAFFGRSVKLQEVLEGFELHLQEVGIRERVLNRREVYTGFV